MSVMRSLGRGVAHHRMRLGGYSRVNDNPKQGGEFGEKRWKRNGHKKPANKEV